MGAWGADIFANDDAMDWVAELQPAADLGVVRAALDGAVSSEAAYLDASVASMALAAAEVVAALRGRPSAELPEDVTAWVAAHPRSPDAELRALAERAVAKVADDPSTSELRDLWDDAAPEDRDAWRAGVADLRRRLA